MSESPQEYENPQSTAVEVEERKIEKLVENNKEKLGNFDIVNVNDAGFLLQSERLKPMAGNDWVLFDYDDTLAATTGVKRDRMFLFKNFLEKRLGGPIKEEDVSKVMSLTDKFSRWQEKPGEGETYHAGAHMSALTWAIEKLSLLGNKKAEALSEIDTTLTRIKLQIDGNGETRQDDPFYFRDRKLILRSKKPWSEEIEEIFQQTMINPPIYEEVIEAAKEAVGLADSIHRTNIGVFTYGEPYYQLLKLFKLLEKYPNFPISQIWLTRKPKGEFIEELVKTGSNKKTELQYVSPELEEDLGESLSFGSGYPLGETPHVIVMFDDNPNELQNILKSNKFLKEKSGATFVAVRSRRPGTKAEKREWTVINPYGEIDFTSQTYSGSEIAKIFNINRFLVMRMNLGIEHSRVKLAAQELESLGVDTKGLKEA